MKDSLLIIIVVLFFACSDNPSGKQPYRQSKFIKSLEWEDETLKLKQGSGDNWPIAWVNDTLQITSFGDGNGFDDSVKDLSLGISYIIGDPPFHRGLDIRTNIDTPEGGGPAGIKASGMIMIEKMLYIFVRNYKPGSSDDYTNARLAWSEDLGKTFQWADWHFSETFGCPEFIQFGPSRSSAPDGFVYVISQDNDNAYDYSPDIVLARVPKNMVIERNSYEFFTGSDEDDKAQWSPDISQRKSIFHDPAGTQRISMSFNPALKRYFLVTSHRPANDTRTHTAALGIFESEFPWGPWFTVYYNDHWSADCRTYHHRFPAKWISPDGREMWLLFSGLDCGYYDFCLKKALLFPY
ncbi:MAG TPA: DUF4185 domain-containing protein [Cyclobacteriaceae bacterium]|nr:DUF4185 domain-containing protein [Cyclobacteriaceae bacterium]